MIKYAYSRNDGHKSVQPFKNSYAGTRAALKMFEYKALRNWKHHHASCSFIVLIMGMNALVMTGQRYMNLGNV